MAEKDKSVVAAPETETVAATEAEIAEALKKGRNVRVQMPEGVTSVNIDSTVHEAEEDGYFHMYIRHAVHAVESFGGKIISEVKKLKK